MPFEGVPSTRRRGGAREARGKGTVGEHNEDPFLIALADRAKAVQENFEDRQTSTADALSTLLAAVANDQQHKEEQAARRLDALSYFVLCKLKDEGVSNAEAVSKKVSAAFTEFPNWRRSIETLLIHRFALLIDWREYPGAQR